MEKIYATSINDTDRSYGDIAEDQIHSFLDFCQNNILIDRFAYWHKQSGACVTYERKGKVWEKTQQSDAVRSKDRHAFLFGESF